MTVSITTKSMFLSCLYGSEHGDRFPQPSATGDWFPLTLEDQSGSIEILRATARQGDMITVTRGAEGTQARSFVSGDAVELRATAAVFANSSGGGGDRDRGLCLSAQPGGQLMVVLSKIYTKTGDAGETALGNGARVAKHSKRVAAYGTVDETNATVGMARLHAGARNRAPTLGTGVSSLPPEGAQSPRGGPSAIGRTRADLEISPNLWAGVGLVRGGAGTALVGDPQTVAARIEEYAALGLDTFVLSGYPHLEEAYRFAELVFPLLPVGVREKLAGGNPLGPFGETVANDFVPRASQS